MWFYFHIKLPIEIFLHLGWLTDMSFVFMWMLQMKSDPLKEPTCKRLASSGFCTIYIVSSHLVWCTCMFYRLCSTVTAVSITGVFHPRKPSCNNILMSVYASQLNVCGSTCAFELLPSIISERAICIEMTFNESEDRCRHVHLLSAMNLKSHSHLDIFKTCHIMITFKTPKNQCIWHHWIQICCGISAIIFLFLQ